MTNEEVYTRAYDEVKLRGLSPHTVEEYLGKLTVFLKYFNNCPISDMGEQEIREFLLYQLDSGKSSGTVNIYNSALRFIFGAVIGRNLNYQQIPRRRQYREFPPLMSKEEIAKLFSAIDNLRDKAMFVTAYGAGLRISEIARLRAKMLTAQICAFLCPAEKVEKTGTHYFLNKILNFYENIGKNIAQTTRMDIFFTLENKKTKC